MKQLETVTRGGTRISRRAFAIGTTAAASAAYLSGAWNPRRSMAQDGGSITVRIFPFGPNVEELYEGIRTGFESENPGTSVTIDLQPWDNRYPKLLADVAAGTGPDVFFITTDVLIRFAEASAIAPVSEYLPAEVFSGYEQSYLDEVGLDGATWFVPYDREVMLHAVNLDILEQVGMNADSLPQTWDDVNALCQAVADLGDPFLTGFGYSASGSSLNTTFYPYLRQAGGVPISEDGSEATFNGPEGVEALTWIADLFAKGWADQAYLQPMDSGQDPFTQGFQALSNNMFVNGLLTLRANAPDLNYHLSPILTHKEKWGFGGMRSWAMSGQTEQTELSAAFLEYLARPENAKAHGELAGTFPALTAAREGIFESDPEIASLASELQFIFGEQKHKYGRDLMPLVVPEIQAAIIGEKDAQTALNDAATAVNELFAQG